MAMCARKDLERKLRRRREAFRKEMEGSFLGKLKSRIDHRMVVVHGKQERLKEWQRCARTANRNMQITI